MALVVHKPAGIATQAAHGICSLETLLRDQLADRTDYLAFPHRLDRPVSGVILVATRKRAARLLSDQFATRKVTKLYHAWVHGKIQPEQLGNWIDYVRKIPDKSRAEIVPSTAQGAQIAETQASLRTYDTNQNRSLLELSPRSGRMHQLRLQTSHRGFPIIGDLQYGGTRLFDEVGDGNGFPDSQPNHFGSDLPKSPSRTVSVTSDQTIPPSARLHAPFPAADRILLQAHQITFHDPINGALKTVTASDESSQNV